MPWNGDWQTGGDWFASQWFGAADAPGSVYASIGGASSILATLTSVESAPPATATGGGGGGGSSRGRPGRLFRTVEDARIDWKDEVEVLLLSLAAIADED